jgi:hypothetical protein
VRKSHRGAQTFAATDVERDNLVLGDAVEMAIRPKAQTAGPAKIGQVGGRENANETSASGIVFPHRCHRIECAERLFARHNDVAVGRDRQIKRAGSGSLTSQTGSVRSLGSNATIALSPMPLGPIPEASKNMPW